MVSAPRGEAGERLNAACARPRAISLRPRPQVSDSLGRRAERAGWISPCRRQLGRAFEAAKKRVREWSAIGAPVEIARPRRGGANAGLGGLVRRLLELDRRSYQPAGAFWPAASQKSLLNPRRDESMCARFRAVCDVSPRQRQLRWCKAARARWRLSRWCSRPMPIPASSSLVLRA